MLLYEMLPTDEAKLEKLNNPKVMKVVTDAIALMKPDKVMVFDDSPEDIEQVRLLAIENGEEKMLAMLEI